MIDIYYQHTRLKKYYIIADVNDAEKTSFFITKDKKISDKLSLARLYTLKKYANESKEIMNKTFPAYKFEVYEVLETYALFLLR